VYNFTMPKLLIPLLFLSLNASASSFVTCDVAAEVLSHTKEKTKIKVVMVKQGNSGYGDCGVIKGSKYEVKLKNPEKLNIYKNKTVLLNYHSYSAMTPNGPISGVTWMVK